MINGQGAYGGQTDHQNKNQTKFTEFILWNVLQNFFPQIGAHQPNGEQKR